MDHNMDFGINLAQDTMSNAEKRDKKFQPGFNMDMRNATQNFLAAEMGGGFQQQQQQPSSQKLPEITTMHDILTQDSSDIYQNDMNFEPHNPFDDDHQNQHQNQQNFDDDDEFEHDSLNFSPTTISKSSVENENVKFISSKDLLDDFDNNSGKLIEETNQQNLNQFESSDSGNKNELIVNLGQQVDLEFKVEPNNVKLISSDTLLDDFGGITTKSTLVPEKLPTTTEIKTQFNDFVTTDLGNPIEKIKSSIIPTEKFDDFHIDEVLKPSENKNKPTSLMEDFELIKPVRNQPMAPTAPAPAPAERKHISSGFEDDFFSKSSGNISPPSIQSKTDNKFDHDKFISNENFDSNFDDHFKTNSSKVEEIKEEAAKVIDDIKNKLPEILNPFSSAKSASSTPSTSTSTITPPQSKPLKTEPKKPSNIMEGEVIFHRPNVSGGSGIGTEKSNFNLHPLIESLIYWRDIKISGIVFTIGLIILLALIFFSVISVIAYTSIIALMITVGYRLYKYILCTINNEELHNNIKHPIEDYLHSINIDVSQEYIKKISNIFVANMNAFISELKRLFLVDDYFESIKFGIILWILTYIGSWFNGMTIIIFAYILLFTVPIVYEQNKSIIDQNIEMVKVKMAEINDKIQVYIPLGKNTTTTTTSAAAETVKNK